MAKKRSAGSGQVNIKVGDVSGVGGNINIAGRDISTQQNVKAGLSAAEIGQLFNPVHGAIEAHANSSPADKVQLNAEVDQIQSVVTQAGKQDGKLDEGALMVHFRNICRMAPDILDVVVATLANPLVGLGVAARKIAAKAKEEDAAANP